MDLSWCLMIHLFKWSYISLFSCMYPIPSLVFNSLTVHNKEVIISFFLFFSFFSGSLPALQENIWTVNWCNIVKHLSTLRLCFQQKRKKSWWKRMFMWQWNNGSVLFSCIKVVVLDRKVRIWKLADFVIHFYLMLTCSLIKVSQLHPRLQFNW